MLFPLLSIIMLTTATTTTLDQGNASPDEVKPAGVTDAGGYSTTRRNMLDIANSLYGTGYAPHTAIPPVH